MAKGTDSIRKSVFKKPEWELGNSDIILISDAFSLDKIESPIVQFFKTIGDFKLFL